MFAKIINGTLKYAGKALTKAAEFSLDAANAVESTELKDKIERTCAEPGKFVAYVRNYKKEKTAEVISVNS